MRADDGGREHEERDDRVQQGLRPVGVHDGGREEHHAGSGQGETWSPAFGAQREHPHGQQEQDVELGAGEPRPQVQQRHGAELQEGEGGPRDGRVVAPGQEQPRDLDGADQQRGGHEEAGVRPRHVGLHDHEGHEDADGRGHLAQAHRVGCEPPGRDAVVHLPGQGVRVVDAGPGGERATGRHPAGPCSSPCVQSTAGAARTCDTTVSLARTVSSGSTSRAGLKRAQ